MDGITGRDYNNSFTVATDAATVAGTEDPEDVGAAEAGNGPLTECALDGLPAAVGFTCVVNGNEVDITLTNTAALPAGGPGVVTILIRDNPIEQDGVMVVPAIAVSNETNSTPFALSFTVRNEFSITASRRSCCRTAPRAGPMMSSSLSPQICPSTPTRSRRRASWATAPSPLALSPI